MIVTTYYTTGSPYEQKAKELEKSCVHFGLPFEVIEAENLGSRAANLTHKPRVIADALRRQPDYGYVLFLDADSRILQHPSKIDHLIQDGVGLSAYRKKNGDVRSGTLLVKNTPANLFLMKEWAAEADRYVTMKWGDQKSLNRVLRRFDYKVTPLPLAYNAIVGRNNLGESDVVIAHDYRGKWWPKGTPIEWCRREK
jgi:hypothetical protein